MLTDREREQRARMTLFERALAPLAPLSMVLCFGAGVAMCVIAAVWGL